MKESKYVTIYKEWKEKIKAVRSQKENGCLQKAV